MASKDCETIDILRVSKTAAPKHNILDSQRYFGLLVLFVFNGTFELVNLIIWLLADQLA